jgi:hypothetical protein
MLGEEQEKQILIESLVYLKDRMEEAKGGKAVPPSI